MSSAAQVHTEKNAIWKVHWPLKASDTLQYRYNTGTLLVIY